MKSTLPLLIVLSLAIAGCASVPAPVESLPLPTPAPAPSAPLPTVADANGSGDMPLASAVAIAAAQAEQDNAAATQAPVDPLDPTAPVEPDTPKARADLWQRVRGGFAVADLDGPLVRKWENYYAGRPDYVQRMTDRGGRYLFHIVEEVHKRGMPSELALLPFVESAFNPEALSSARASGIWQFMPGTGRHFDLRQNVFRDDRRSVLDSTRAALDYLQGLHRQFGDWHLALAAYNWGPGNVRSALRSNGNAGLPQRYASLRMPFETRDYVPKLQAVKNIVSDPARYGLSLPPLENHPYFLAVPIARDMDVDLAARLAGLTVADFRALNPQLNKPVILAAGTPQVLLPYDNAQGFGKAVAQHKGPLATWTAWVAPKTMKTAEAAKAAGMDEEQLLEVNNIPPRMKVLAGSTLLVPRLPSRQADVSEHLAEHATLSLQSEAPPLRRVAFKVGKKGDSVAGVARRYGVPAQQVALWNKVSASAQFAAGSMVTVFLSAKPASTTRSAKAAPAQRTRAKASSAKASSKPVKLASSRENTRRR